jgi:hypothetical protein
LAAQNSDSSIRKGTILALVVSYIAPNLDGAGEKPDLN